MPWRGPAYDGEFPTLGYEVGDWIQSHCVVPDREARGKPFILTEEQVRFLVFYYALELDGRWTYERGGQLVRPHKWGKGPLSAAIVCAEAEGPVRFDGWDAAGEPVGRPWATPHIQVTACSEEQTANTWRALQPMIELGALSVDIPDTGLTRINLPGGGLIEPVTASARSRLGQRVTFVVQDQTESWFKSNHGIELAAAQRRGVAGMGGRFLETANAPDPVEQSQATRTAAEPGVYIDDVDGGPGSVRNKAERRKVLRRVYGDSSSAQGGWVDLDRIEAEIEAMVVHDAAQAERWFLNRKIASEGAAFNFERIKVLVQSRPAFGEGTVIVLGIDGARHEDAIAVVATDVRTGHQWPLIVLERPEHAPEDYEHDLDLVDGAVASAIHDQRLMVWRAYCDDQHIRHLIESWQNRFGQKRFITWHTNRDKQIAWAVRRYEEAIAAGDVHFEAHPTFLAHLRNARKRMLTVLDDKQAPMHTLTKVSIRSPLKIDAAMAAVLSWEARSDALASGAVSLAPTPPQRVERPPRTYEYGRAPDVAAFSSAATAGPDDMI
jgi:hypothetical protein